MHMSLWKNGKNIVSSNSSPKNMSDTAKSFVAGILNSFRALVIFLAPT